MNVYISKDGKISLRIWFVIRNILSKLHLVNLVFLSLASEEMTPEISEELLGFAKLKLLKPLILFKITPTGRNYSHSPHFFQTTNQISVSAGNIYPPSETNRSAIDYLNFKHYTIFRTVYLELFRNLSADDCLWWLELLWVFFLFSICGQHVDGGISWWYVLVSCYIQIKNLSYI